MGRWAFLVLAGVMALSGCGTWDMTEERALDHIREEGLTEIARGPEEGLVESMRRACTALDEGYSTSDMIYGPPESLLASEVQLRDMALVLGTAVATYCPEHRDELADLPTALGGYRDD